MGACESHAANIRRRLCHAVLRTYSRPDEFGKLSKSVAVSAADIVSCLADVVTRNMRLCSPVFYKVMY